MTTHDKTGQPYARLSMLKAGADLRCDSGFTCLDEGAIHRVSLDEYGLYIHCSEGKHYLSGQTDDGEHLIGLYPT
jgi:hypothetical protein